MAWNDKNTISAGVAARATRAFNVSDWFRPLNKLIHKIGRLPRHAAAPLHLPERQALYKHRGSSNRLISANVGTDFLVRTDLPDIRSQLPTTALSVSLQQPILTVPRQHNWNRSPPRPTNPAEAIMAGTRIGRTTPYRDSPESGLRSWREFPLTPMKGAHEALGNGKEFDLVENVSREELTGPQPSQPATPPLIQPMAPTALRNSEIAVTLPNNASTATRPSRHPPATDTKVIRPFTAANFVPSVQSAEWPQGLGLETNQRNKDLGTPSDTSTAGDLYLDGAVLGRWITRHIEELLTRAPLGTTAVDGRSYAPWPGVPLHT